MWFDRRRVTGLDAVVDVLERTDEALEYVPDKRLGDANGKTT